MTREEMRYRLNELRMMLNDGEHGEEQGILLEIMSELDKWEEIPMYPISALSENKGEWIPVSERLVPLSGEYTVSDDVLLTNGYEIDMGYRVNRKGKNFWHYYGSHVEIGIKDEDDDVIAWMLLPEPYKAESEK